MNVVVLVDLSSSFVLLKHNLDRDWRLYVVYSTHFTDVRGQSEWSHAALSGSTSITDGGLRPDVSLVFNHDSSILSAPPSGPVT